MPLFEKVHLTCTKCDTVRVKYFPTFLNLIIMRPVCPKCRELRDQLIIRIMACDHP